MTPPRRLRHDRAPEVPPDFWYTDVMVDALASGDLGRVIRAYRFHPFHGQHLPQSLVAGWLHVSQTSLSRIEQGKCRLTIDDINWFAGVLGLSVALRWAPQNEAGEDVDPLSRRSLLGAGVGAAFGLSATTAPTAAREIDPGLVSHWMTLLRLLGRQDAMFGARDVLGTVQHEVGLIAERRRLARGDLRAQLLRVESRWSEFASFLCNDVGDSHMRDSWAERSLRLAQEVGYGDMVAWLLINQSQWAVAREGPGRVIALADAARRTPGTSSQIRALCALRLAYGQALADDAASCERSLTDAHDLLDHADTAEMPREGRMGDEWAARPCVLADEARCWIQLRPDRAIALFDEALRLWPRDRTRGRGVHQARLALACAAAGEPERAAAEGVKALSIAQATKSEVITRQLKRLDHRLAARDTPAAAGFREALATLS